MKNNHINWHTKEFADTQILSLEKDTKKQGATTALNRELLTRTQTFCCTFAAYTY